MIVWHSKNYLPLQVVLVLKLDKWNIGLSVTKVVTGCKQPPCRAWILLIRRAAQSSGSPHRGLRYRGMSFPWREGLHAAGLTETWWSRVQRENKRGESYTLDYSCKTAIRHQCCAPHSLRPADNVQTVFLGSIDAARYYKAFSCYNSRACLPLHAFPDCPNHKRLLSVNEQMFPLVFFVITHECFTSTV